ncbi:class I SAM-dependent methyltransferase [Chelativorans sp.]|uniref:class I SAM-dependent methyltransferase n=1 Tax=Chelativorans sp. TaxID=2203393 RepID=UPI00281176C3|nr:class I SAM-dependent methyltransferase [Chelativorans sp.]
MTSSGAIDLLFGGMEKLGPGSDAETLRVLQHLPDNRFDLVVDAGCGAGRQTIVLARELRTPIHAIDSHQPFLDELDRLAQQAGVRSLIHAHRMDIGAIPERFSEIDLLWSEGAAYNIGFANALKNWASALRIGGIAVVSELAWLQDNPSRAASEFFRSCYPDMRAAPENVTTARELGYTVLDTHTLPQEAWIDRYYDVLEPRARALQDHEDDAVRHLAQQVSREIEVFRTSQGSYGYVFYVLQRNLSFESSVSSCG